MNYTVEMFIRFGKVMHMSVKGVYMCVIKHYVSERKLLLSVFHRVVLSM